MSLDLKSFVFGALVAGVVASVVVGRGMREHAAAERETAIRHALYQDFGAPAVMTPQLDAIDTWKLLGLVGSDYQRLQGEAVRSGHWQEQMSDCYRELQAYKSGSSTPQLSNANPPNPAAAVAAGIWDRILPGSGETIKKLAEQGKR